MNELQKKLMDTCKDCKFFSISTDGYYEIYECFNEDRWIDVGYDEDDFWEDDTIYVIAVARGVNDFEIVDLHFNFNCKYKVSVTENKKERGKND